MPPSAGPKFPKQGNGRDGADARVHAKFVHLEVKLRRKHRPGEGTRRAGHELRAVADLEDLMQHQPPADCPLEQGRKVSLIRYASSPK